MISIDGKNPVTLRLYFRGVPPERQVELETAQENGLKVELIESIKDDVQNYIRQHQETTEIPVFIVGDPESDHVFTIIGLDPANDQTAILIGHVDKIIRSAWCLPHMYYMIRRFMQDHISPDDMNIEEKVKELVGKYGYEARCPHCHRGNTNCHLNQAIENELVDRGIAVRLVPSQMEAILWQIHQEVGSAHEAVLDHQDRMLDKIGNLPGHILAKVIGVIALAIVFGWLAYSVIVNWETAGPIVTTLALVIGAMVVLYGAVTWLTGFFYAIGLKNASPNDSSFPHIPICGFCTGASISHWIKSMLARRRK